jgi:hypothetical protein
MLTKPKFYSLFKEFGFMLVYKLDSWVFEDKIDDYMDYDYVSAPVFEPKLNESGETYASATMIGDGGFSLYKISTMIELFESKPVVLSGVTVGKYLSTMCEDSIKMPDLLTAASFSFADYPDILFGYIKKLPVGCHKANNKIWYDNFWYDKIFKPA